MKPQHQTSFGGPKDKDPGNCWSTCIAIILSLDTSAIPNFCGLYPDEDGTWHRKANEWLSEHGLCLAIFHSDPITWGETFRNTVCIASGQAVRGHKHSVVWRNGKMLHDPHPSGDGLIAAEEWDVLLVADPDRLSRFVLARDLPR